jgi:hypothetical protein
MTSKLLIASLIATVAALPTGRATAQRSEAAQHEQMMTQHQEMGRLIDQLLENFSTLENEKDPVLLKQELAHLDASLKELLSKYQALSRTMGMESMMMHHGANAMGFSQTATTHHFLLKTDGGVIQVETNSSQDTRNRDLIRSHLAHIAQAFAAGDFSDPLAVHDQIPTGVPVMQGLKAEIRYRFEAIPDGGRVLISTGNQRALAAIHQFLRFQIREHQTGDPLEVK